MMRGSALKCRTRSTIRVPASRTKRSKRASPSGEPRRCARCDRQRCDSSCGWSGPFWRRTDRDAIFDYIEADSPQAAIIVDNRIRVQVESLVKFPESGRPGRVEGTRELVIQRTPYIAAYRVA